MSTERQQRWREISGYLDEALDLEPQAREVWMHELQTRAPTAAHAVRALLAEHERPSHSPLDDPPAGVYAGLAGQQLGAYTLESVLGHGGMGTVWLARRSDGRFEGRAAVKLLSAGLLGRPAEQRFVQEGSVLAKLHHPNIAQLIDAGVTAAGQPYLVLELVEGERIDVYAAQRALGIEARVRLFLDVLAAVAHAHSHLVVHRDLKPSNIFVTSGGVVKLLDFGVAALLGAEKSELTRESSSGLTPEYAAPEQLLGQQVTTATDVYALGLVLFVLLVGQHPLNRDGRSQVQLAQATLGQEPPRVSDLAADQGYARVLRGDLDNIVAKALKKDPRERYASAELFAQDLRHYLANEPVSARADTVAYRTAKFVRRHGGGVVTGVFVALALIAAVVVTTAEMFEARRQRDAAIFQSKRAEYQARFAYQIMSEIGSGDRPITVREVIQKGVEVLEKNYGDDPRFMIDALTNISGRYMDIGDTENEYAALLKAEKLARRLGDPALIASVECDTVETELNAGRPQLAARRMQAGLDSFAKVAAPAAALRIGCETAQARLLWGQGEDARAIEAARKVALFMQDHHLETDIQFTTVTSMLDILLGESGNMREALLWNQRGLAALQRAGRGDTMSMTAIRHNQAIDLQDCGEVRSAYEQEAKVVQDIVAREGENAVPPPVEHRFGVLKVQIEENDSGIAWIDRAVHDAGTHNSQSVQLSGLISRARAQLMLGKPDRARADIDSAERLARDSGSKDGATALSMRLVRAQLSLAEGKAAQSIAAVDGILRDLNYPAQQVSVRLAALLILRARSELQLGNAAQALRTARDALAIAEVHAVHGDRSIDVGDALLVMARSQLALGDSAGAHTSAQRAAAVLANSLGPNHSQARAAAQLALSRDQGPLFTLFGCRRLVLIQPRFSQRLPIERQEQAQVDRLRTLIRRHEIEHGAPCGGAQQGPRGDRIDAAPRGRDDRLDVGSFAQRIELASREIDYEAPRELVPLLTDDAADAGACCQHAGYIRATLLARPVQAVRVQQLLAALRLVRRIPERHDVIQGLVPRRNLHEHYRALAPVALRLHPHIGPLFVPHLVVFVLLEVTLALHQPEATRLLIGERVDAHFARVVERPPDPLAGACAQLQSIRIVHLGPPVVAFQAIGFTVEEHAGAGGNADALDGLARVDRRIDVHEQRVAHGNDEAIGARNAGRIEQAVQRDDIRLLRRPLQVVGDKIGKLLRGRHSGVDGQPALGHSILAAAVDGTKVRGPLERRAIAVPVGVEEQIEARKSQIGRRIARLQTGAAVVEQGRVVGDLPAHAILDVVDLYGLQHREAQVKEARDKGQVFTCPERAVLAESDRLPLVPVEPGDGRRELACGGLVGRGSQRAGLALQPGIVERLGRPQGVGDARGRVGPEREAGKGCGGDKSRAVQQKTASLHRV
jgi:tetratricopeptide (TPR) repeat protein